MFDSILIWYYKIFFEIYNISQIAVDRLGFHINEATGSAGVEAALVMAGYCVILQKDSTSSDTEGDPLFIFV